MDPWCLVQLADGTEALFGFAVEHAGTGGLSWVLSTSVVWLDVEAGRARTLSGRRYTLGRRITAIELPTEEARIAFALLVSPHLEDPETGPPFAGDADLAATWVAACKMARHLKMDAPPLHDPAAIRDFVTSNMERYVMLRNGRRPS
ncbi:hypothetical protein JYK14_06745 [Siccirubricoccus sp. KC 17139]|uniref:Uncharacterized protein n=1 Tax=Siccirubricoccus soli TaxID=2899147 RepID=A0ABT1D1U3_9PROT|nr:hypothetical protein [Siccirubricoccus soli]MCO6415873.1 hypothetical protein [Siccirubricoccus soli]MCP2682005.1 hypothetical protein [Siccirubricoccus soli]